MANATPFCANFQPVFAPEQRKAPLFAAGIGLLLIAERNAHAQLIPCARPDLALPRKEARCHARLFRPAGLHHARDQKLPLLHARAGQDLLLSVQRADPGHKSCALCDNIGRHALICPLGRAHALAHLHIGPAAAHVHRKPAEVLDLRHHAVADILRLEGVNERPAVHALLGKCVQDGLRRHGLVARHLKIPDEERIHKQQRAA